MPTNAVAAALDAISLGSPVVVRNLTMIPLLAKQPGSTAGTLGTDRGGTYSLLDDAIASGAVEITEVSDQGSVPELRFLNRSARAVLIIDGEELLGAKQNRIVNLSILAAAKSDLTIPVSCVEAGRWRARSRSFTAAPRTQYATGRAKRMADVSLAMRATGERLSNQADVWHDIAAMSSRLEAESSTSAMEAIFDRHGASIDEYVAGCQPIDGQVGAMFLIGDRVIGFDLFDRASTLASVLPKLVRGVAVDAIDLRAATHSSPAEGLPAERPADARATDFLSLAASASPHVIPAIGLGEDVRLTAPGIAGAALIHEGHLVHLGVLAL